MSKFHKQNLVVWRYGSQYTGKTTSIPSLVWAPSGYTYRVNYFFCIDFDVEGTLEIPEIHRNEPDIHPNDIPKPTFDYNPSEEDVRYMRQAQEVSKNSPDPRTKVI